MDGAGATAAAKSTWRGEWEQQQRQVAASIRWSKQTVQQANCEVEPWCGQPEVNLASLLDTLLHHVGNRVSPGTVLHERGLGGAVLASKGLPPLPAAVQHAGVCVSCAEVPFPHLRLALPGQLAKAVGHSFVLALIGQVDLLHHVILGWCMCQASTNQVQSIAQIAPQVLLQLGDQLSDG
jgi:hypothetical protein